MENSDILLVFSFDMKIKPAWRSGSAISPPATTIHKATLKKSRVSTDARSNVTWKEPVADLRILPPDRTRTPLATKLHESRPRGTFASSKDRKAKEDIKIKRNSDIGRNKSVINPVEMGNKNPYKRNDGKNSKPASRKSRLENCYMLVY